MIRRHIEVRIAFALCALAVASSPALGSPGGGTAGSGRCVEDTSAVYRVPIGNSPVRGGSQPLVTVVMFSDFQCPYCSRAATTMDELAEAYGDDVRLVFKQMPLDFHANAHLAAEASLAAHQQGRFWDYAAKLFANQTQLEREWLEAYAEEVGLNMAKFRRALDNHQWADAVDADRDLAARLGVTGTPTFFLNGRKQVGALTADRFREIIDAEIERVNGLIADGADRATLYDTLQEDASLRQVCRPEAEVAPRPADTTRPSPPSPPSGPSLEPSVSVGIEPWNASVGPADAPVTLVVFGEYLCPFCQRLEATLD